MELQTAELDAKQIEWFHERVSLNYTPSVTTAFKDITVTETTQEITFDMFFDKYDKRNNKARCEKVWNKLTEEDKVKAFFGLWAYYKFLSANTWRTKMEAENYLKNRCWENEWK